MEFIFLLTLLFISSFVFLTLKLKMEQSLFFSVCALFMIMLISGLLGSLRAGFYAICAAGVLSAFFFAYKAIKKEADIKGILTPGIAIFIGAFIIYYISTRTAMLHLWDEATHWGTSAKKMFYMGTLWTSGLQTIATPIYNQIMLNLTGYSEGALYLSQWTLYLSCIVLPLSGIGWKKSPFALVFSAVCIFAVASVIPEGNLSLYADGVLAFFFGSLVLSWYLEKDKNAKRYIWAAAGLFMLVQIKSGTGLSMAVMFTAFALFSDAVLTKHELPAKKVYIKNLITAAVLGTVIYISNYIYRAFENHYLGTSSMRASFPKEVLSSAMFAIFAVLFIAALVLFVIYTINVFAKKPILLKKTINKLLVTFASLSFVAILGVLFYSTLLRPGFDVTTTVLNFLKAFTKEKIFGVPLLYSIIGVIILFASNCILSSKSERINYIGFYSAALIFSGLFVVGVLYAYLSSFALSEAVTTASFERYVGTAVMFAAMFAFMPYIRQSDRSFKKLIPLYSVLVAFTIFLAVSFTPAYKAANTASEEASVFRRPEISGANYVKERVSDDKKVFLVIQQDSGFVFNWMRYEFVPIATNGGYWSFGDNGGWNFPWTADKMKQFFIDAHYDYLYLFKSDDYFAENFAELFGEITPQSKTLYKFAGGSETVFTPVD